MHVHGIWHGPYVEVTGLNLFWHRYYASDYSMKEAIGSLCKKKMARVLSSVHAILTCSVCWTSLYVCSVFDIIVVARPDSQFVYTCVARGSITFWWQSYSCNCSMLCTCTQSGLPHNVVLVPAGLQLVSGDLIITPFGIPKLYYWIIHELYYYEDKCITVCASTGEREAVAIEIVVKVNQEIDMNSSLVYHCMGCTEYQFKHNEYSLPKIEHLPLSVYL